MRKDIMLEKHNQYYCFKFNKIHCSFKSSQLLDKHKLLNTNNYTELNYPQSTGNQRLGMLCFIYIASSCKIECQNQLTVLHEIN